MDIRIKEVINNLKNYDFDILGNYKMDGAEAKKLIEAIEENEKKITDYTYMIGLLQDRIEEIEKSDKWIPVSERLPEENVEVLVTTKWGSITIAERYSANDYFIYEGLTTDKDEIIAWMPLPQAYKAESEGEE